MNARDRLTIRNFAHLAEVDLSFGDLTVLVGPQAAGKSLALQWLKLAVDGRHVTRALRDAGQRVTAVLPHVTTRRRADIDWVVRVQPHLGLVDETPTMRSRAGAVWPS